jgi:hypothetical protein
MKTFVLTVSRTFPKTHKRAGQQTWFVEKINEEGMPISDDPIMGKKIHTIRANYELWEKRIKEVQEGKAILSLRYWSGEPYRTKQIEFAQLDKDSGVGVQELKFGYCNSLISLSDKFFPIITKPYIIELENLKDKYLDILQISKNDGLKFGDFMDWFKNYDLSKPMAIIHFTSFRY